MIGTPARAVMALALVLMRAPDRHWAQAMAQEFEEAERDGHGLRFASGCVMVAARRLTASSAGWHGLSRYGVALGIVMPMALFHLGCELHGLLCRFFGTDRYPAALEAGDTGQRMIAITYRAWTPSIVLCLLLLGALHILIAWWMVASDWRRAGWAMGAASAVVAILLIGIAAIQPTVWSMMLQGVALAAESLAVPVLAAWQARQAARSAP